MRITEADLRKQFDRANKDMPLIRVTEDVFMLPPFLLYALGSRETNLRDIVSSDGHGRGIFQRDDRSFAIPDPYPVGRQTSDAASLLIQHFLFFRDNYASAPTWRAAVCAYNAGRTGVVRALQAGATPDSVTTGRDYGVDVLERWTTMVRWGWNSL